MQDTLCNAVVRLKLEMYRLPVSSPSAIVLDSYNALFWRSDMFHASSWDAPLRRIDAQELTLGANLRVLGDADIGHTAVLGALTMTGDLPDMPIDVMKPKDTQIQALTLPLLDLNELGSMLLYYRCACAHMLCPHRLP